MDEFVVILVPRLDNPTPPHLPQLQPFQKHLRNASSTHWLSSFHCHLLARQILSSKHAEWVEDTTWKKLPEVIVEFLFYEVLYLHFSVGTENKVVWKNMASMNLPQRVNQKSQTLDIKFQ